MNAAGFQDLLNEARAGDDAATGKLLMLVRDHLARSVARFDGTQRAVESTSDLIQDASLRLWQHLHEFRGGSSDDESLAMFLAWSEQIVNRLGLNVLRTQSAQRRHPAGSVIPLVAGGSDHHLRMEPLATDPSPSANARSHEEMTRIKCAVDGLPDDLDRELLRLRFFEGRSMRQIAEEVPLSYDQIRDRFQRIMRRLERELEGLL